MTPAWTQTVLWHQPWNLRQRPGYGSCNILTVTIQRAAELYSACISTKLTTAIVCNDLLDCMEHDLGLVDDHDYVGLGKCESDTSTKWSALDSPPSLGSRGWHHLAIYPYSIFVLWNRMWREVLLSYSQLINIYLWCCASTSNMVLSSGSQRRFRMLSAQYRELRPFAIQS